MDLFARDFYAPDTSFTPLFRLLSDWDAYSRESGNQENAQNSRNRRAIRNFNPKFDIRELENSYELHGELAGLSKEDVNIEFTDENTLVIRGHIERKYTSGTPPAGSLENGKKAAAITENGESHKATVEDEKPEEDSSAVSKTDKGNSNVATQQPQHKPKERYWVQERSIGEFSRTFTFPAPVDHDAVSARLDNGVLTVVVPKAKKPETRRRIAIN
ncbi:HSP20-like chaperone [Cladorrhinum samala]|uniref:HSP20-like chaperone n=1 Tax=Cladorrhinum samala TaxID=585594 RepID=A0AAV9HEU0_9PEZI|nr:HSP20-like chaperone [Cladorrhinum samala]